jgi:phosphatidylserine decarboxylase
MDTVRWTDRLATGVQYALPQLALSRLMHSFAHIRWRPLKELQIRWLASRYRIDLSDAAEPDPRAYPDLNAFFTRALRAGARPLCEDPASVLAPADGTVSAVGTLLADTLVQAKGHRYTVGDLLADPTVGPRYQDGSYLTVYLSPQDYHRVHMPVGGQLIEMRYVPGRLFSVNDRTSRVVPRLFARNERVVARFDTEAGEMALVLVGALMVGGLETVWSGPLTPPHGAPGQARTYPGSGAGAVRLGRGEEMGRFNMGSTVIALFQRGQVEWDPAIGPGLRVRVGGRLGRAPQAASAATQTAIRAPG